MSPKKFDAIVIGELNVDLILNNIDSFPEMGKEKIAKNMTLTLGSSSAIFASNLSSLGANVAFLGKIGNDSFGGLVTESLRSKNVDIDLIIRDKNSNTGATIVLNYKEDRAMVTYQGAMNELTINDISEESLSQAKHLHFSSYYLQPGMKKDISKLFKMAKDLGLSTSFDMQWDPYEKWDLNYEETLPLVDVFLPNELELKYLTRMEKVDEALDALSNCSNTVIVKMGNKGSLLFNKGKKNLLNAFLNNKVVDAIGAGDSFNAGFIFKFIQGENLEKCQEFGNLMGAVSTTAAGGTSAFSSYKNVLKTAKEKFNYSE
ncbi:MAG: carbohydrate kinase family protein [Ignavibacteriaceae bacterium]